MAPINYLCLSFIFGLFISLTVNTSGSVFVPVLLLLIILLSVFLIVRLSRGNLGAGGRGHLMIVVVVFYLSGLLRPQLPLSTPDFISQNKLLTSVSVFSNRVQTSIKSALDQNLPEPQSSLGYGMIFGNKAKFDKTFMNDLRRTGTAHMVAVSGYNVSIIVNILLNTSILLISKAFLVFGFGGLIFYDVLVGFSASVTRATIMGLYLFAAGLLGRQKNLADALLFSAALILLISPASLFDLGFQLSFLSMLGVMYLSPLFEKILEMIRIPESEARLAVSSTLASQILILPVGLYNFGQISIISPLANLLTFLTVPPIMALTALELFFSYFLTPLGWIFGQANLAVLNYFVSVVSYLSILPWASVTF